MDIGSGNAYPSNALSNFAPHPFVLDGVLCNSMEGFLQSLKFKSEDMQKYVCTLVGKEAKYKGKHKNWQATQTLYWQGKEYKRDSEEYQILLNRAYNALYQNSSFRNALEASKPAILTHKIGRTKESDTVLTQTEFVSRLMKLRMGERVMIDYVIQYDNSLPIDKAREMATHIQIAYPDEKILFIPQFFTFKSFSLDEMIEVRDQMTKIIEELQAEEK